MCSYDVPAHAALPGAGAAWGGRRGLIGPAVVRAFQVANDLWKANKEMVITNFTFKLSDP